MRSKLLNLLIIINVSLLGIATHASVATAPLKVDIPNADFQESIRFDSLTTWGQVYDKLTELWGPGELSFKLKGKIMNYSPEMSKTKVGSPGSMPRDVFFDDEWGQAKRKYQADMLIGLQEIAQRESIITEVVAQDIQKHSTKKISETAENYIKKSEQIREKLKNPANFNYFTYYQYAQLARQQIEELVRQSNNFKSSAKYIVDENISYLTKKVDDLANRANLLLQFAQMQHALDKSILEKNKKLFDQAVKLYKALSSEQKKDPIAEYIRLRILSQQPRRYKENLKDVQSIDLTSKKS